MNGIKQGGMLSWLLQRISGAVLVVLLAVHFWIMHYTGEESIKFEAVRARLASPTWKLFYVLFLVFGLYHGLNGLRSVLIDFDYWRDKEKALSWILVIIGIVAFAWGTLTVYSI